MSILSKLFALSLGCIITTSVAADPIIYDENNNMITVTTKAPEFTLKLKSNPTTGYTWFLQDYDDRAIEPVAQHFEATADKKLMGAPGVEVWRFKVKPSGFKVPQQTIIHMTYARPWGTAKQPPKPSIFRVFTIPEQSVSR